MCERRIKAKTLIRSDSAANWREVNPTLLKGELGYDETNKKFKMGDGTTPWNSLSYVENGSSGEGTSIELKPIYLDGTITGWGDDFGYEGSDPSVDKYNQFLQNKAAPIRIEDRIFQLYEQFDSDESIYYCIVENAKYFIYITWMDYGDTTIDNCWYELIKPTLEPIIIEGDVTIDGENYSVELNITEENYQQFLKNKTAPVVVGITAFQVNEMFDDGLVYYYYIYDSRKFVFAIYWNEDGSYLDDMYTETIGGNGGGSNVSLEPIKIEGYADFENGEYELTFTDLNYQQVVQNKTAPIVIGDTTYYPYWYYGEQEDGGIYIYYRNQELTYAEIIAIYWLPNEETFVDDFMCNTAATNETLTLMCTIEGEASMYPSNDYTNYLVLDGTAEEDFSFDNSKKYLIEIKNYTDIGGTSVKDLFYFDENNNLIPKVCCHWSADNDSLIPIIISGRYDEGNRSMNIQIQSVNGDPLYGVTITIHQIQ